MNPETPKLPADLQNRYQVLRLLGQGGFGGVWLCRDCDLDRLVALKLLHQSLEDPELVQRFRQEAQVTSRLHHANVVTLYDFGLSRASGQPWIAYEYIEGQDLASLPATSPWLQWEHLIEIGGAISRALQMAHDAGIVHRDLKPANVLLRKGGEPVLCDFGISRLEDAASLLTAEGMILGTPAFMAPEIWKGAPPGPASDQYSWAASLFLMLYGETVFSSEDPYQILRCLEAGDPIRIPVYHQGHWPSLERVLLRALSPDPRMRFPRIADFGEALESCPQDRSLTKSAATIRIPRSAQMATNSSPSGSPHTLSRKVPEQEARTWGPFLVLPAILLVLVLLVWGTRAPTPPPPTAPARTTATETEEPLASCTRPPRLEVAYQRLLDLLDRKPGEELVPQPSVEDLVKVYPRLVTYEIQDQWLRIHRETLRWVHQEPQPCSSQEIGTHMEEIFGRQTYQALTYLKNTQRRLQDCASLIEVGRDLLGASTEYKGEDCPEDWKVAEVDLGLAGLQKETDRTIEEILAEPGAVPPQFLNPLIRLGSLFPLKRLSLFLPVAHREFLQARTGEDLEAWGIIQHEILHHTRDIGRLDFSERTRILFESMDHLDQVGGDVPEEVFANLQVRMLHQLLMASFIHPGQDYTPILDRLERAFQTTEALLPDQRKVIFPFAEKASRLQMDFIFDPRPVLAPWIQRARELARAAEE